MGRILVTHTPAQKALQLRDGISFKELKEFLRRYGFQAVETSGRHKAYSEPKSGALVLLPNYADSDKVSPLHVRAVTKLLSEKGIVE